MTAQYKEQLFEAAKQKLALQIEDIEDQLNSLAEDGESEEKSSAGDKYETQMEMLKQSQNMLIEQLGRAKQMLKVLKSVPLNEMYQVQEGSLLSIRGMDKIWVSVPLGKLVIEENSYQLVSSKSPLCQALWGKKTGDKIDFNGRTIMIEGIG